MASLSDSASQTSTTSTETTPGPSMPSDTGRRGPPGSDSIFPNTSASLYLYTFLATLVLLLGVSAAIVFRSLLLRRRQRRLVEEAIRNGTYVPPAPGWGRGVLGGRGRGTTVDPKNKPEMWEAWLGGGGYADARQDPARTHGLDQDTPSLDEKLSKGTTSRWQGLMPVSLLLLKAPESNDSTNVTTAPGTANASSSSLPNTNPQPRTRFSRFMDILSTSPSTSVTLSTSTHAAPPTNATLPVDPNVLVPRWATRNLEPPPTVLPLETENLPPQTLPTKSKTSATVRVSLLIAMPSSDGFPAAKHGEEGELPHLEVGSVEVEVPAEVVQCEQGSVEGENDPSLEPLLIV